MGTFATPSPVSCWYCTNMKLGGDGKVVCTDLTSGIDETFFTKKKVNRGGFLGRATKGDNVEETRVACAMLHVILCQTGHETIVLTQQTGFHKEAGLCERHIIAGQPSMTANRSTWGSELKCFRI
eukprot:3459596-Amphidinium_carterae.1